MIQPILNWKICKECGKPFDIGTNLDICIECRIKKRCKDGRRIEI